MTKSESIANLAAALCHAQAAFTIAIKSKVNPFFKSKYADLQTVWDAALPGLTANGLSVVQMPSGLPSGAVVLQTMLLHSSGEWICDEGVVMTPAKLDPQGIAAAITYARRAGFQTLLGVVADEDDDGEQISRVPQSAPRAPKQNVTVTETPAKTMPPLYTDALEKMLTDCARGWADWDEKRAWSKAHKTAKDTMPADAQERIKAAFLAAQPVAKPTTNGKEIAQ